MAGVNQCSGAMASMTGASAPNANTAGGGGATQAAPPAGAATSGASLLGGGPGDIASMLQQLTTSLQSLVASLSGGAATGVAGAAGAPLAYAVDGGGAAAAPAQGAPTRGAPGKPAADPAQGAAHAGHKLPTPPAKGDPRFLANTVGPTVAKGKSKTIKIPDGKGFGGVAGRKQNADDKTKNNYSVTDANFSNQLGLLPANPDTGKPLNYVQHIQMYSAANYLEAYNQPLYQKLVAAQDAGKGTILGAAAHLMGLVKTADPAEAGLTPEDIAAIPAKIPGTPMDARAYVQSGKDITGQVWARPHHAGSQFKVLSGLISAGVGWQDAMVLAGDDGISGSGRLNGVNTQDGNKTGLNAGEREIFSRGAQIQKSTGINVVQLMMGGHNHLGGDASALTKPKLNKIIGVGAGQRQNDAARADLVYQSFLNGKAGDAKRASAEGTKADYKPLLNAARGPEGPRQAVITPPQAAATGAPPVVSTKPS